MISLKTPIVLGGIAIALIILFLTINRFALPTISSVGKSLTDSLSGLGNGVTDFFNSFDNNNSILEKNPSDDPFYNNNDESLGSAQEALENLDPNSDTYSDNAKKILEDKFGILGIDKISKTDNDGLEIESNIKNQNEIPSWWDTLVSYFTIPQAFGDDSQPAPSTATEPAPSTATEPAPSTATEPEPAKNNIKTNKQNNRHRKSIAINEIGTQQKFTLHSSDSGVIGIIRATKQDPKALRVDSQNNPIETASQRANRLYMLEHDIKSTTSIKYGKHGKNSRLSLKERKKIEEQRALETMKKLGMI